MYIELLEKDWLETGEGEKILALAVGQMIFMKKLLIALKYSRKFKCN